MMPNHPPVIPVTCGRAETPADPTGFPVFSDAEFHNVEELEACRGGWLLQRLPRAVREHADMNPLGRLVATKAAGAEIRFVTTASRVRITLGTLEEENRVYIFRGDFACGERRIPAGGCATILLEAPLSPSYFTDERFAKCRFNPNVWRVWCGRQSTIFYGLDAFGEPVRPPAVDEKPRLRWLAYGSSFTMGANAVCETNCYAEQAANALGVEVLNLGLGGSCHAEPHLIDHLAARPDWDFATIRLGGNMIGVFEPDEYRRRAGHALRAFSATRRPLVFIGLSDDLLRFNKEIKIWQEHTFAYTFIDKQLARSFPRVTFLTEIDLLPDFNLLAGDMLHPSDAGHFQIANRLAAKLRELRIVL